METDPAIPLPRKKRGRRSGRRLFRATAWTVVLFLSAWYVLPWLIPWPDALSRPAPEGAVITDRNGTPLRRLLADGRRAGAPQPLTDIPPALIQSTLAAEDRRFFLHGGVDFQALIRAARDGFAAGRSVSGASTITQQLVKLAVPRPRTVRSKILEILTARRVEMTWPKERVLAEYLNRLEYGNLHTGPAAAAAGYFGKPLTDCSLAECALLAGLPQAPSRLNPWRHPEAALKRRNWVLSRLLALGAVTPEAHDRAAAETPALRRNFGGFLAPHFVDLLLRAGGPPEGARITTTLDLPTQEMCERAVDDRLSRLADHSVSQAAVVVIDNESGDLLALVGSRDHAAADAGQVNGAAARRSPGSALKPFTFLLALQRGDSPGTVLPDLPVEFMTDTGLYRPRNYNGRASGPVSLRQALANSLNLAAVRLLEKNGGPAALMEALHSAGVTTLNRSPAEYGLGLTIGGGEVTLLELTRAYACLARLGEDRPARLTTAAPPAPAVRLFDPAACWLLADILADNDARARSFGTSSALRLPFPCAVKTGTSTDYRDNWTIGYTPRHTVGVWVGNFDNRPMRGVSGVTGAAPVFRDIMTWLEQRAPSVWYPRPESVVSRDVDPLTGLPVPPALVGKRPAVSEKFLRERAPSTPDPSRYDAAGRVLLPAEYTGWLAGPDNWLGSAAAAAPPGALPQEWRISSPVDGSTFLPDPDLPGGGLTLPLRTEPSLSGVVWSSRTLEITGASARLSPGAHVLTARDPRTGLERGVSIKVRAPAPPPDR